MLTQDLIVFSDVCKGFTRQEGFKNIPVVALDHVSFRIDPGEFVGLIGHNGAGKSTSIKLLMGFIAPTSGDVFVRGHKPNVAGARRSLGYVPENSSFSDFLTGKEILSAFGRMGGLSKHECDLRSGQLLASLEIAHAADRLVKTYSKGMTQRLAIAQALIGKPDVLILDEPMTGLDPIGRRLVLEVLLAELKRGVSLLFCSHLLADVEQLCHRILWLNRGKVHYDGPIQDLLQDRTLYELVYRGTVAIQGSTEFGKELYRMQIAPDQLAVTVAAVEKSGGRVESFQPASKALEEIFVESAGKS